MTPEELESRKFQMLVQDVLSGQADEAALAEFEEHLRSNRCHRDAYFQQVWLDQGLAQICQQKKRHPSRSRFSTHFRTLAVAAVILISASLLVFLFYPKSPGFTVQFSNDAVWTRNGKPATAKSLTKGDRLELSEGVAALQFGGQVRSVIEGPAELVFENKNTVRMLKGSGWFRVEKGGEGFTVVTEDQKIVDLGTEFGVRVQPGNDPVELQVFEGEVAVSGLQDHSNDLHLKQGALLVKEGVVVRELELSPDSFLRDIPKHRSILLDEDFEGHGVIDGDLRIQRVPGWSEAEGSGLFNPDQVRWYYSDDLIDSGPKSGSPDPLKGPTLGFFYNAPVGSGIQRNVGRIESDTTYQVSLVIGVRSDRVENPENFDGYRLQLMSKGQVLAEKVGSNPPGPPGSFTPVMFSWSSDVLPSGLVPGDELVLRIEPNYSASEGNRYLDFDHIRVSSHSVR